MMDIKRNSKMNRRNFLKKILLAASLPAILPALSTPVEKKAPSLSCKEILVPTFEIASNPTIMLSEIKARRFYIVDRKVA